MWSKPRRERIAHSSSPIRSFADDDRAIEGLPIRLIIAMVIGVACLGIMLQVLGGVGTFETNSEVDVEFPDAQYIETGSSAADSFAVDVIDEDGNEVPDATVVATAGSARMDGALVRQTDDSGQATFDFRNAVYLPPDSDVGTIKFEVQTPADTDWVDDEPNNELIVTNLQSQSK